MVKQSWKLALMAALVAGMSFAACGDDTGGTNNANNTTGNNTTGNNTTGNNQNNTANNTDGNNTTPNNTPGNNTATNNTAGLPPDPPSCGEPGAPDRCEDDPSTIEWGAASLVDDFFIEGEDDDPVCCFDFTGDEEIDNALGSALASFNYKSDVNESVAAGIEAGELALVLEHAGLTGLDNSDEFTVNFWLGEHQADWDGTILDSGNLVSIDPTSIDDGAHPKAYLPNATIEGGVLTAGPGKVTIELELFESPLQLTISQARIQADVDAANSDLDDGGVSLTAGRLGGVIHLEDVFVAVNTFAATCDCLGLSGDLVTYNPESGQATCDESVKMCDGTADAPENCVDACENQGETACQQVGGACSIFNAIALFADVDTDGNPNDFEAISVGATFTAVGASIQGLAQ